ncbi:hypothetical protein Pla175_21370 [Pirellulimonas nuda]|uniref:MarR family protein n=2 Tax=Pirellulimonas nuda TaxID=2528009 RepID=A0A518DB88_9BACT|nr:hypothetical protein Pla175_21370 [Pirellulimonas nuda]
MDIDGVEQLLGVTATAVRQRFRRLMADGLVERSVNKHGRGRPGHLYHLTEKGLAQAGTNYSDLAETLWEEVRAIPDAAVRLGLVQRLGQRLAEKYASQVNSEDLAVRMQEMAGLMADRDVPISVDESSGLPVLNVLACPYPGLAVNDREVCHMEQAMISELLGRGVELSECRLDGGACCSFQPNGDE